MEQSSIGPFPPTTRPIGAAIRSSQPRHAAQEPPLSAGHAIRRRAACLLEPTAPDQSLVAAGSCSSPTSCPIANRNSPPHLVRFYSGRPAPHGQHVGNRRSVRSPQDSSGHRRPRLLVAGGLHRYPAPWRSDAGWRRSHPPLAIELARVFAKSPLSPTGLPTSGAGVRAKRSFPGRYRVPERER